MSEVEREWVGWDGRFWKTWSQEYLEKKTKKVAIMESD